MIKNISLKWKILLPIVIAWGMTLLILITISTNSKESVLLESGIQTADLAVQTASKARSLYAQKVIPKIDALGGYTHDNWQELEGAVPAAATLMGMIGESVALNTPGVTLRLYSQNPFTNRELQLSDFEKRSLKALKQDKTQPYYEIVEKDDQPFLQYAVADIMTKECVTCHNSHHLSPKKDWKEGDLRGAVGIVVPLEKLNSSIKNSFIVMELGVSLMLLLLLVVILFVVRYILSNIIKTQDGLSSFFSYLNRETPTANLVQIASHDEFGTMAKMINKNIIQAQKTIEEDKAILEDITRVVNEIKKGKFSNRIEKSTTNKNLIELKAMLNEMLQSTTENVNTSIQKALSLNEENFINSLPLPSAIIDEESNLLHVNQEFQQIFEQKIDKDTILENFFIQQEEYIFKDPIFDWKRGEQGLCTGTNKALIEINGYETEFFVYVKMFQEHKYVVCLLPIT